MFIFSTIPSEFSASGQTVLDSLLKSISLVAVRRLRETFDWMILVICRKQLTALSTYIQSKRIVCSYRSKKPNTLIFILPTCQPIPFFLIPCSSLKCLTFCSDMRLNSHQQQWLNWLILHYAVKYTLGCYWIIAGHAVDMWFNSHTHPLYSLSI